jgi:tetratricopeptide (TPR) repeat protein
MKTVIRLTLLSLLIATCVGMAFADKPGRHPHYLHALSDLRHARALLDQLAGSEKRDAEEERAIRKIDDAINEIKRASIDDGKDLNDHPPIDAKLKRAGRYHKALELLDAAHKDVTMEEDDAKSQGLQGRVIAHVDEAHRIVEKLADKFAGTPSAGTPSAGTAPTGTSSAGMASANKPGRHPHYLHALSDLRHARAHLDQLAGSEKRDAEEEHAIRKIDDAINEIKRASIDDGKNLNDHPPIDAKLKRVGRYHKALELLDAAHKDVTMEEDDAKSQGLQGRIIAHVDEAHRIVERLAEKYKGKE